MSAFDAVLLAVILLAIGAALFSLEKTRKKGSCIGCSGNCESCKARRH